MLVSIAIHLGGVTEGQNYSCASFEKLHKSFHQYIEPQRIVLIAIVLTTGLLCFIGENITIPKGPL